MTKIAEFDILNSPLEGTSLIEASAGTGKTYTIAGLFLRLIIEKDLPIDKILVVTFTEAATEALKSRIRKRLREAANAFSSGESDDLFLNSLVKKYSTNNHIVCRIEEAIRSFDQASIFTIHGFCMKMLQESAFESGNLFDTELVANQDEIKREIVDDFWRMHFYHASSLFINHAFSKKFHPRYLLSLLGPAIVHPDLKIIPEREIPDASVEENLYIKAFNDLARVWPIYRADIEKILTIDPGLNRNKYRQTAIPLWLFRMDEYAASTGNNSLLFEGFDRFTPGMLSASVKKNYKIPDHPFFLLCENLQAHQEALAAVFNQALIGLKTKLIQYVQVELEKRKQEKNIHSFDDLVLKLFQALNEKRGKDLVEIIKTKFSAALIDEFQDTDPAQYTIFNTVFSNSILFLIGDPKQAIYGFRGADIFTYMKAARHVTSHYTLGQNWRSTPDLTDAVNALFKNADLPFLYREIPFQPVAATKKEETDIFSVDGQSEPCMRMWYLSSESFGSNGKPVSKAIARELITAAVANEISRLLDLGKQKRAFLGDKQLRAGDIAVLVRRNSEAAMVRDALLELNIPGVIYNTGNIFETREAFETERVLSGILFSDRDGCIKAALTTDILGLSGEELCELSSDETRWENLIIKFKTYHDLWKKHGFIRMFRHFMHEEKILSRLMAFPDGERRNTNLRHLMEILHQTDIEKTPGMEGLLKWLSEQRFQEFTGSEEHQLRLESDENAVTVITVHKSKGLEYPIVFCPFTWDGSMVKNHEKGFPFHDEADNMRLTLEFGSDDMPENRIIAEKEQLAENLRLLYVALTRARNRCYLVWGRFKDAENSAPAYLFHQPDTKEGKDIVSETGSYFKTLRDENILADLTRIADSAESTIQLSGIEANERKIFKPLSEDTIRLSCRQFSGTIPRGWRVSSFSSLVSDFPYNAELADRDESALSDDHHGQPFIESTSEIESRSIFSFPKGTKPGIFMHDIFENFDFTVQNPLYGEKVVTDTLKEYGFDPAWQTTICNMIQKVLSATIDPADEGLTLSCISSSDRVNEMEFYFPLLYVTPGRLKKIFAKTCSLKNAPERIGQLSFSPTRGFMKGFIDMVFHYQGRFFLVDWKSNFLGDRIEDYSPTMLAATMEKEYYILQYHIYTVALHRYLQMRMSGYNYDEHFGGVCYIFLRGVDVDIGKDLGIYRDKPPRELIEELCKELIET